MSGALDNTSHQHRIDYLDGLRGLAILMVVVLHYLAHPEKISRVAYYHDHTIVPLGNFGVQMFFIISGYVIFMTLDKTPNFFRFIVQRWIRLFPAMLVATVFIVAVAYVMPYRPGGIPRIVDLVPGLTLAGANFVSAVAGVETIGLERGFWSLYVEFRYYIMFGALFYLLGRHRSFFTLTALSFVLLCAIKTAALIGGPIEGKAYSLFGKMMIGLYLPWFLFGMYAYLYRFEKYLWVPFVLVANAAAYHLESVGTVMMSIGVPLLAFALFRYQPFQQAFRARFLLFLGAVSYPLYLINDSIGRGLIRTMYEMAGGRVPFEIFAVLTMVLILVPSWIIARLIEPPMQRWLKRVLLKRGGAAPIAAPVAVKEA